MKIRPVGAKMFHAVRRTDMKLTVDFPNFVTSSDKEFLATQVRDKCNTAITNPSIGMAAVTGKETRTSKLSKANQGVNHELRGVSGQ